MTSLFRLLWQFEAEAQGLVCAFTPNAQTLIAGAEDGTIYAFDLAGNQRWTHKIEGEAFRFALSQQGSLLAIGTIRGADTSVLNYETGELLWKFSGDSQTKAGVAVSADGERVVSGDDEGKIRAFARDGTLIWTYECSHKKIARLGMTPDGERIVFGGNDHIYCLNGSGDLLWKYRTGGEVWAGARILPDGSRIIGGSNDQHVYVLDAHGNLEWRYKLVGNVNITYPTPDGTFIAAGSTDSHVYLFSGTGQLLWKYRTGDSIYGVSMSNDGEFIAAASYDRFIYLFNREGDLLEKQRTANQVYVVDITEDGRFIGSFGFDKRIYLLENRYATRNEAERADVSAILTQRVINQARRAFVDNLYYGLCYWFDQFNHLLRRSEFNLCDALIAEARQDGYPFTAAEQRFVDSREGAVLLKRGVAAQRKGDFEAAEAFYKRALSAQRAAGCGVCENQARLAFDLLTSERNSGEHDPLLDKLYDEVFVMGGSEAMLTGRLASAPPDHLPLIIQAATKMRLIKPLLQALKSSDTRLQMLAIATLNRFTEVSDTTPLMTALNSENAFVRWQAAAMLSRQKELPASFAEKALDLISAERDPDTRRVLVETAAHLKVENLTPLLIPMLEDSDNDLRWSVVTALGKIGDRRALPALRKTLEGYTLMEMSIHDALQRAIREIDQRFPLPKLTSWNALRPHDAAHKAATLYWHGEPVLFVGNLSGAKDNTRLLFTVTDGEGAECYRLSLSYVEFAAATERLRAELEAQGELPIASPFGGAPSTITASTAYDDDDDNDDSDEYEDNDEFDEDSTSDRTAPIPSVNLESRSGALWVQLSAELTQAWQPGGYTAVMHVLDEVTGLDEPIGTQEFSFVSDLRVENIRVSLSNSPLSQETNLIVEYVETIYFTLRLSATPLGTELRGEVWYGTPDEGELVLSETRHSLTESDTNLQFQWQQPHWRVGNYTARLLVNNMVKAARNFEVKPYRYDEWQSLPNETPYLWDFLARHLIRIGQGEKLLETVKDLRYLAAKTALRRPYAVEADLNLAAEYAPQDVQIAALRREYARVHHVLGMAQKSDETTATLYLWLRNIPELAALAESYEREQIAPRLALWHDLPSSHPALIRTLRGHSETVGDCTFSADGRWLATVAEDQSARVWDMQNGNMRFTLRGLNHRQYSCDISRDGKWLLTSGWQHLQLWDMARGVRVRLFSGHGNTVVDSAFHPNGTQALSAGNDGTIRLWDVESGAELSRTDAQSGREPTTVAYHPDGSRFCSAHQDGTLQVWQPQTFELLHRYALSSRTLRTAAFSPRGDFIAAAGDSREVFILPSDAKPDAQPRTLTGHDHTIHRVAFSPDGEWLASTSSDSSVRLWRWRTENQAHLTLRGHLQPTRGVAFSPNGSQMATSSEDKDVKVWDVARLLQKPAAHPRAVPMWYGTLSDDGRLALSDDNERLILWDTESGLPIRTFDAAHTGEILGCAISPDGTWALSGGHDHTLRQWEVATGKVQRTFEGHSNSIWRCAISPDGRWFISASADQSLRVWDVETGEVRHIFTAHSDQVNGCAISPNGRYIASAGADGIARLWYAEDGADHATLNGHGDSSVLVCTFSPDNRFLVTGAYDKKIKLWEVETGNLLATLEGHTHNVQALAFTPNGEWLLSGARNGGLRLWRMADHACVHSVFIDRGVTNIAFLPNGERVMVASGSGLYLLRLQLA